MQVATRPPHMLPQVKMLQLARKHEEVPLPCRAPSPCEAKPRVSGALSPQASLPTVDWVQALTISVCITRAQQVVRELLAMLLDRP